MELTLDELSRLLRAGKHIVCEVPGHNTFYQFQSIRYIIAFVEGQFMIGCYAKEFQLWRQDYESLKELVEQQPLDLRKFRLEGMS